MVDPARVQRWLRRLVVVQLVLLTFQFEFGESLSIAGLFPTVPSTGVAVGDFSGVVVAGGPGLLVHTILGFVIFAGAVLAFLVAWFVRIRWLRIVTGVELAFVLLAGLGGLTFVLSGFANDSASYQMSTSFIVAFIFAFLALYLLKTTVGESSPKKETGPASA